MTKAYKDGMEAARAGKDITDNPHANPIDEEEWFCGFSDFIIGNDCVMSA